MTPTVANSNAALGPIQLQRVLLCVTGLNPQILTEVLFADARGDNELGVPWRPDVVRVITTQHGEKQLRQALLEAPASPLHDLCERYVLPGAMKPIIHVIEDENGTPINDIVTPDDNAAAADFIAEQIRKVCSNPDLQVHVSIAGGRKTMGLFAASALSFFGRQRDRLSHVLVSEPFETFRDFYFPEQTQQTLMNKYGQTGRASDARIWLAALPFVRMSRANPARLLETGKVTYSGYCEMFEAVPTVEIDISRCRVICSGQIPVTLSPVQMTVYAYFAWRLLRGEPNVSPKDYARDIEILRRIYRLTLASRTSPSGLSTKIEKDPLFNYETARIGVQTSFREVFGKNCAAAEAFSPAQSHNGIWGLPTGLSSDRITLRPHAIPPMPIE